MRKLIFFIFIVLLSSNWCVWDLKANTENLVLVQVEKVKKEYITDSFGIRYRIYKNFWTC